MVPFTAGVLDVWMEADVKFDGLVGVSAGAYFESLGFERNVVVTTRPRGYRKFPSKRLSLLKPFLRKYPAVYKALKRRPEWYNKELEYIEKRIAEGAVVLVSPPEPLPISRVCHDPEVMQRVYEIGRVEGERALDAVQNQK